MPEVLLHQLLDRAATTWPERIAIEDGERTAVTYRELERLSNGVRDRLRRMGVRPGDRVAFCMRKSIDAVATIFGALKAGAAYVPLDPGAPVARNSAILRDAEVAALVAERQWAEALRADFASGSGPSAVLVVDGAGDGSALSHALAADGSGSDRDPVPPVIESEQPAYILYTSGSTGSPKGVVISHRAALSFVQWCAATFGPVPEDVFSSHAPFHFDLSVFDLFVAIRHGARVVLISEAVSKEPLRLADLIAARRVSIWYSVPSVLMMLAGYGKLARHAFPALRLVLFAGEVFPIVHLRAIQSLWRAPRYFNLYGPTETNVCTFFEIPASIPEARTLPFPIGRACSHFRSVVVDESGAPIVPGSEGELCVQGPAVMSGYWKRPADTAGAFLEIRPQERWYRTGDLVIEEDGGLYDFRGRRDRMVKRRGYRIELAEIEAALHRHPDLREAAVVALPSPDDGLRLKAFLSFQNAPRPSVIALKRFCAEVLPSYMVPDLFEFPEMLPRTSTGKVDYQRLQNAGSAARRESMEER